MRVYIISDVYPPEPVTAAGTARDIAEELTRRGHETTVFAPFPNRPTGNLIDGYRRTFRHVEHRDGYRIIYSWHTLSRRSTVLSRTAENISFGLTSALQLLREPAPDVVYMNTWPIFAQWLNISVMHGKKAPVICVVHDLYPETFSETRQLSQTNPVVRLIRRIDNDVYRKSTIVTALNPIQQQYLNTNRRVPIGKLRLFHDWLDATRFPKDRPREGGFREKHGLSPDQLVAMYVGSMTRMAGLELYVDAAECLRGRKDIRLLLVGDGAVRESVSAMIRAKGLDNIELIHPLNPVDVPEVQAAADVLLLSLLPGAAEHTTPSKLIFYMFSQRPVVASVTEGGPPARIIEDADCGYVIRQGDFRQLAERLEKMADDRAALPRLGQNARHYAEENFLKDSVLPRVCDLIEEVGGEQHDSFPGTHTQRLDPTHAGKQKDGRLQETFRE